MINRIPSEPEIRQEPQRAYELTLKDTDTGEILYQATGYGGVLCFLEDLKEYGLEVEGNHQVAFWGNPMVQAHCMEMLKQESRELFPKLIDELKRRGLVHTNFRPENWPSKK